MHVPSRVATKDALSFPTSPSSEPTGIAATVSDSRPNWPGRRATTILLGGCNLSCPFCFDPEHVGSKRANTSVSQVVEQISLRAPTLDGVVISGGEPTTCVALGSLLRALAATGLPVKLDTNGTNPDVLEALIEAGLLDFIALDVKTTPERYDRLTGGTRVWERVERSVALLANGEVDHEFRTTCYPFALPSADLPSLAARLAGGKRFALQQFQPRRTLDPAAATVSPYSVDELRRVAIRCAVHLPTVVRGV
ncbi:MAG: anaerobic ribonucleoside-triphosphate reductase activating protein [Coriobacteriia bacterium]|nr:anaerobic ribonucleoside-triphosphate reductase activating protein [Coriobacteriia bacterium]